MSGYQQYSGNPYSQAEAGYGGPPNPYGGAPGGYGASNPYGGNEEQLNAPPALQQGDSNYSQASQYSANAPLPPAHHGAGPLSRDDYLARIDGCKGRINQLTSSIQNIASIHQRMLSSPDGNASAQLESLVSQTQISNGQIKDEIKFLERDASREPGNAFKRTQVESLKRTFQTQLRDFQDEESAYQKRYREAIARQYRIVNPEATEAEVQEAANADWGDEGIFQTALKSNRTGQASSVLGAVRARHNDIQRIEKTLGELALLFRQLDEAVVYQEAPIQQAEQQTAQVHEDNTKANEQLTKGIKSARNARKLKWWLLIIVVIIICIIALALGIYFGTGQNNKNKR
ncbi:t-SNARE [Clohesyomyces aquaticus]|uniref:t-SNARE n=1 Tax=Clohesyomyces aquaticus TaxID=1231657 RepID=A0A1Y1ZSK8_9PLEO|nr:t-SNARE [Clohesyomyces aquaticus]